MPLVLSEATPGRTRLQPVAAYLWGMLRKRTLPSRLYVPVAARNRALHYLATGCPMISVTN